MMDKLPEDKMSKKTVLVVDDEKHIQILLRIAFSEMDRAVYLADDGEHALKLLAAHAADIELIVSDIQMSPMNGIELLKRVRIEFPHIPVILWSSEMDQWKEPAIAAGAMHCLQKGSGLSDIEKAIKDAFAKKGEE